MNTLSLSVTARLAVSTAVLLMLTSLMLAAGCSSDTDPDPDSDAASVAALFDSPSKDEVNELAGLAIPADTEEFRSVVISETYLNVQFKISSDEVDAFTSDSNIELTHGDRVIKHDSPIWELNVEGDYAGSESVFGPLARVIEVVDDGTDLVTVRMGISIIPTSESAE